MPIRLVSKPKEDLKYRVFCDTCNTCSNCSHEDPGDLAIKAKKERFVTVQSGEVHEPMQWLCCVCNNKELSAKSVKVK